MKTIVTLLFLFGCSFQLFAQKPLGIDTLQSHHNHQSWVGEYEYTDPATGVHYDLIVEDTSGTLHAYMEVESHGQAIIDGHFECSVEATEAVLKIKYISHKPYMSDNSFTMRGTPELIHLHHENGVLITEWMGIMPPDFDTKKNRQVYFKVLTH